MNSFDYVGLFELAMKQGRPFRDLRASVLKHETNRWERRTRDDIRGLVIHQTAGGDSVTGLARYHTNPNHITETLSPDHPFKSGLPGIAYTFFIDKLGVINLVNDIESMTWSHGDKMKPGDENKLFMSACFGGKFKAQGWADGNEEPTAEQLNALAALWRILSTHFCLTDIDVYGHYHFGKPTCPGDTLKEWIDRRRGLITHNLDDAKVQQKALAKLGYYKGAIDGAFGPQSKAALHAFLRARDLPVTDTWTYLGIAEAIRLLSPEDYTR